MRHLLLAIALFILMGCTEDPVCTSSWDREYGVDCHAHCLSLNGDPIDWVCMEPGECWCCLPENGELCDYSGRSYGVEGGWR